MGGAGQALESCEVMREEEERKVEELGETILELRTQQSTREVLRATAAARVTPRPQGPLQMTGAPGAPPVARSAVLAGSSSRMFPRRICTARLGGSGHMITRGLTAAMQGQRLR